MLSIIAVVCPPVAVLVAGNSKQALLNVLLTLCLWVPGVIHAFRVINASYKKFDDLHAYEERVSKKAS